MSTSGSQDQGVNSVEKSKELKVKTVSTKTNVTSQESKKLGVKTSEGDKKVKKPDTNSQPSSKEKLSSAKIDVSGRRVSTRSRKPGSHYTDYIDLLQLYNCQQPVFGAINQSSPVSVVKTYRVFKNVVTLHNIFCKYFTL